MACNTLPRCSKVGFRDLTLSLDGVCPVLNGAVHTSQVEIRDFNNPFFQDGRKGTVSAKSWNEVSITLGKLHARVPLLTTHAASSRPANRQSLRTWCTPGSRRSNNEEAEARAAAQANSVHHRKRHPCSALFLRVRGSNGTLALITCLMKDIASWGPSACYFACHDNKLRLVAWRSFLCACVSLPRPRHPALPRLCGVTRRNATLRRVWCQPPAAPLRTTGVVHDNFQATRVVNGNWKVQVAHKQVCGDSPRCLTADAGRSGLHCQSPSSRYPCLRA